MGRIGLTVLLALSLALPAFAAADSALPVGGFTVASNGTLSGTGTLGGVPGAMTSTTTTTSAAAGTWNMTVGGVPFASGTYSCSGGSCTYTGTVIGSTTKFSFSSTSSATAASLSSATGFSTNGAWVSTVAHWAGGNRAALAAAGLTVGGIVSAAAHAGNAHAGGTGATGGAALSAGAGVSHGSGGGGGGHADHDGHGR